MPKQDSERALSALERWAADPARPVILLTGATQSGKTVLLDVLAARLARYFSVVYLAHAGTDPDELSARILTELGDPADGTPRLVLAREIERRAARPLLLLLDDADALPPRVELWLFDLARRSEGALRLVLALSDARLAREFAAAFHADTEIVSIGETMSPSEAGSYLVRVEERSSDAAPISFRRRATSAAGARTEHRRAAPLRGETPAEPSGSHATLAGPQATPPADPRSTEAAPSRVRVSAAPLAPRADAPVPVAPTGVPLRWIVVSAALALSFVAGFVLSEIREAQFRVRSETVATRQLDELPAVSPSVQAATNEPTPSTIERPPAASEHAPVAGRPDPFTDPLLPRVGVPREEPDRGPVLTRATEDGAGAGAAAQPAVDASPPESLAPDRGPAVSAADPVVAAPQQRAPAAPLAATAPFATETTPARDDADAAALAASADASPSAPSAELPAVSAPPPPRRRSVAVQVEAEPGAEIRIGDRLLGPAPVGTVDLPPGAHRLLVRLPDGREVERIVDVRGTRYEIQVR
jgi:hypothetical protein